MATRIPVNGQDDHSTTILLSAATEYSYPSSIILATISGFGVKLQRPALFNGDIPQNITLSDDEIETLIQHWQSCRGVKIPPTTEALTEATDDQPAERPDILDEILETRIKDSLDPTSRFFGDLPF